MNDKKNIDRFFQEKFKDFEMNPNEQVWKNIQTALDKKKKKRKTIPFWIKFPGIAAAFLLGLFALNSIFKTEIEINKSIVLEPNILKNSSNNKGSVAPKTENNTNLLEIKKVPQVAINNTIKTGKTNEKKFIHADKSKVNSEKKNNQTNALVNLQENYTAIKQASPDNNVVTSEYIGTEKNGITTNKTFDNFQNKTLKKSDLEEGENAKIAATDSKKKPLNTTETPNELEEILKKKKGEEKEAVVLNQKNKWQITPNIAAVYLNSNSGGSAIDPQFSENQKTADNSLSFGVGVNYAVSKKVALRSGINKLSLGYNTNNVVYSTGLANNNLANINYSSNALIEIKNEAGLNTLLTFEKDLQKTNTGAINQKMGYYEVPLEISYAVLDKKFGINVIGGVSTLFLSQNKISLVSSETNVKLGEAKNLNQVHFSTNVGLGFKYQIIKSFQINVEPMLKYQLNTFSNNSGDFKPLFIGLYSGISYSF